MPLLSVYKYRAAQFVASPIGHSFAMAKGYTMAIPDILSYKILPVSLMAACSACQIHHMHCDMAQPMRIIRDSLLRREVFSIYIRTPNSPLR